MELRQLRYFVAVAEELSFSRAAERVHITQPPLSRQIQELEAGLGCALFVRAANRIELTQAGEAFLREARKTLHQADWAARSARLAATGDAGELRIGYVPVGLHTGQAMELLSSFRRRFPCVTIELVHVAASAQPAALFSHEIDLAICHTGAAVTAGIVRQSLCEDETVFAVPNGHRLARSDRFRLADLADEDFIAPPRSTDPEFHDDLFKRWALADFRPRIVIHADSFVAMLALVAAGAGISFAARKAAQLLSAPVTLRPAEDFHFNSGAELRWLEHEAPPAALRFAELASTDPA